MKNVWKLFTLLMISFTLYPVYADNQTADVSPIYSENLLPFSLTIEQANFSLPVGIHSGIFAIYKGLWVFIAGRLDGLHGFGPDPFPPSKQNTTVYVVNPETGTVSSRSLLDPSSGLTQTQINSLSVTSPQGYQEGATYYMTGGYSVDLPGSTVTTKSLLTAIYLPGIIQWVTEPNNPNNSVVKNIQQLSNPLFQVAGGEMYKVGNVMQLVFGQNFTGVYTGSSNGIYTNQVRRFKIKSVNGKLAIDALPSIPSDGDPNFRRRDLNILPTLLNQNNLLNYGLVAYGGVFTDSDGVWTVPVVIDQNGVPNMANPSLPSTFKQGMNQYVSSAMGFYSKKYNSTYHTFLGGMSFGFFSGGVFTTDSEIPFINQVTTVKMDSNGNFTQYLMNNEFPVIISTDVNPGNPLLFGSGAYFMHSNISRYANGVINLDNIRTPTVIGYIVGGIVSTLPNTNTQADSFASTYVFKVMLVPR